MATISNSARISGLATGLDVEEIVDGLTEGTHSKIDEAEKELQILDWEQEAYQEVTDKMYDFMTTYCGTSTFSLSVADDLSTLSATNSGSDYVTVTTSPDSLGGDIYISDIISLATAAKVTSSSTISSDPVMIVDTGTVSGLSGKSMTVSLDGTEKTITFSGAYTSTADVVTDLQSLLDGAFGSGRVTVTDNGDDTISLGAASSTLIIKNCGVSGSEVSDIVSFTDGAANRIDLTDTLAEIGLKTSTGDPVEFTVNGTTFSYTSDATMQEIMDDLNGAGIGAKLTYSEITDIFTLASTETGAGSSVTWSDVSGSFLSAILGTGVSASGTNAVLEVSLDGSMDEADFVTITRSSNTFNIDGTTYTLLKKASGDTEEGITIGIDYDTEALSEKITAFVDDYNEVLDLISDKLNETIYDDYKPLTDDDKEDMTDDEIEAWNEKAKSGILRSDTYLKSIYSNLRSAWFATVLKVGSSDVLGLSLTDIGITTKDYSNRGRLEIDEDTLLDALNTDAKAVIGLLTQTASVSYSQYATEEQQETRYNESGLFWRVADIVHDNLSTTGVKGALIELVGSPSNGYSGETAYNKKNRKERR